MPAKSRAKSDAVAYTVPGVEAPAAGEIIEVLQQRMNAIGIVAQVGSSSQNLYFMEVLNGILAGCVITRCAAASPNGLTCP